MRSTFFTTARERCRAEFLSPKDFLRHVILSLLVFGILHLLGWREYASFLNGTTGSLDVNPETAALLGILYVLAYLATIVVAPILLIAAAIQYSFRRFRSRPRQRATP